MNKTIRRLKQEIEQRGGQIHIDENLPDDVAEFFSGKFSRAPIVWRSRTAKTTAASARRVTDGRRRS